MAEYIEREKLKENLESYIGVWLDTHTAEVNEAVDKGIELALRTVKRQPAADVVEVVRCKDCKYWNWFVGESHKGICNKCDCLMYNDDFCSYGEKREA